MREKAQLVVDLLKEYFKNKDVDCYGALCLYNPDTDLTISDNPLITGEFYIITTNNKIVLDISPTRIDKVFCNNPTELIDVINFHNLCGSCNTEEDNGSWDKTIEYLKSVNGNWSFVSFR